MQFLNRTAIGLVFCAGLGFAGSAMAQTTDGGQLRVGAFLQGQWNGIRIVETPALPPPPPDEDGTLKGFGGGISIGYDWRFNQNWIVGIEADISITSGSATYGDSRYSFDHFGTVRGRLGTYLQPNWMIYATGGYAFLGAEYQGGAILPAPIVNIDKSLNGWTIGIGTEINVGQVKLFAEYLHSDFGKWTFFKGADRYDVDVNSDTVRVGVKIPLGN